MLARIDDVATPGGRIAVTPPSTATDRCTVCGEPFAAPAYRQHCEDETVVFLHGKCERRYLWVF